MPLFNMQQYCTSAIHSDWPGVRAGAPLGGAEDLTEQLVQVPARDGNAEGSQGKGSLSAWVSSVSPDTLPAGSAAWERRVWEWNVGRRGTAGGAGQAGAFLSFIYFIFINYFIKYFY